MSCQPIVECLKKRGVTVERIADIVRELQLPYNPELSRRRASRA